MKTTHIISLTHPWTPVALDAISATFPGILVERYMRRPDIIAVHAEITEKDLVGVVPAGVPYKVEQAEVIPFPKQERAR